MRKILEIGGINQLTGESFMLQTQDWMGNWSAGSEFESLKSAEQEMLALSSRNEELVFRIVKRTITSEVVIDELNRDDVMPQNSASRGI